MMNPIIRRELAGVLRTPQALVVEVGPAVLWTLLVIIRWPTDARIGLSGAQSQQAFMLLSYGLLAVLILMAPIVPSGSIIGEKQRGTLGLLLISPISAWSIYLGKLISMLGFVVLLLATSIPAAVACYALGGISFGGDVLSLYALLFMVAVQMVTLGLAVSSFCESTDSALRFTFGGVWLIAIIPLGPQLFLQGTAGTSAVVAAQLRNVSPISAVMQLVGHGDIGSQGTINSTDAVSNYLILATISVAILALATVSQLNQSMLDRSRASGKITDDRSTAVRSLRRVFFLVDPRRRKSGIRWWMNPVMVKEFRCRRFGRLHWLLRLVAACGVLSLTLTYATTLGAIGWNAETIGGILVMLQGALLILLTPSLASGLISTELESGGWNLLRVTPFPASSIVCGKLLSVVWTLLLILCATLPGYAVMIFIKPALTEQVKQVMICLMLTAVFALLLSATVSSFFRRTAAATATAYALLLTLMSGTTLVWLGRDAPFGHNTVEAILTLNPLAAALSVIGAPGFTQYQLIPANWWVMGSLSACLLLILCVRSWKLTLPD